jgi:hypothetical protein
MHPQRKIARLQLRPVNGGGIRSLLEEEINGCADGSAILLAITKRFPKETALRVANELE